MEFYIGPPRPTPEEHPIDPRTSDFELVRRFDVLVSVGDGIAPGGEGTLEPLAFRRDWLVRQGVRPAQVVLIQARGQSMEPVISDGDLVMVDTSRTEVPVAARGSRRRDNIYWVVRLDGDLRIKDVERTDARTFVLTSENTREYRPEVVSLDAARDFEIVGRVAWWGHTVPL